MFYYCEKCANIKNVSPKGNQDTRCDLCETLMKPVPDEYLMASGSFFKSQDAREELITFIKANAMYDESVGEKKEELQQLRDKEEKERISATNEKMEREQFKLTCPACGSKSVQKISTVGKYAKVGIFGILGADDLGKTWKCKVCGCKF